MRLLIVTQFFYPENFKSNDVAFELAKKGYKVSVLTGLPNYPKGKVYKGYGLFRKRIEKVDGVTIYRSLVVPRGKGSGLMLALNYFSWAFFASFWALFLAFRHRYDAILVHETSPITQGFPALIVRRIQKIPMYFWVLDLWPESLQSAGGVNNKFVLGFFARIAKLMYSRSKKILVTSKGFYDSIVSKGPYAQKIVYFPNWDVSLCYDGADYPIPPLPQGFLVMYAGNIGEAQDFDNILQAALLLKEHPAIKFVFVGDGRKRPWVESFIREHGLEEKVFLLGQHPRDAMPSFFRRADVMLLALKDELIFGLTVPAKLQSYMAAAKPVVAMINGEARNLISESMCGYSCGAGDYRSLCSLVSKMSELSKDELSAMGNNGYRYFMEHFEREHCISNFCQIIGGSV